MAASSSLRCTFPSEARRLLESLPAQGEAPGALLCVEALTVWDRRLAFPRHEVRAFFAGVPSACPEAGVAMPDNWSAGVPHTVGGLLWPAGVAHSEVAAGVGAAAGVWNAADVALPRMAGVDGLCSKPG